jgi:hypothetical protein
VTRSHVLAWHFDLETQGLNRLISASVAALASLYDYLL